MSLVDDATGRVLDRVEVPDPGRPGVERVTLTARSGAPGETTWSVVVEGQGRDLVPANDRRVCRIELVDRPIRVLYVEGYPRWEYRYLKTLLVREKLIESSVMLLSADRDFAQEGNVPISRLPRSAEEFAAFDLVILGDLPGSFLTSQQAEAIRDLVATRGSGVLWIGGQRFTPGSWKGSPLEELLPFRADATKLLCQKGNECPELRGVYSSFKANSPQLVVTVFREKAKSVGVDMNDVFRTLQVFLGSEYVNDFDMGSRIYRVYVQADQKFRSNPKDIERFYVRSKSGKMISLSNLVTVTRTTTPQTITHYNLFRSTEINGSAAPGISSGQAMEKMEQLARENLPPGMGYEWSGIALEQTESGSKSLLLFGLGFVFVFLVLAAQYESFVDPFIILFSVPLAMLGALGAQSARGLENDVFCQIGLVMLIGLASKNAILIVEYANQLNEQGLSTRLY